VSKPTELKRLGPEDLPGAPEWFLDEFLPFQNAFNEDVHNRLSGDIGLDNLTEALRAVKLTHGVEKVIRSPLWEKRVRPAGVYVVGSDGLPVANITWRNLSIDGIDQIGVTAYFDNSGEDSGYAGERLFIGRDRNNALGLTTNVAANIGTTASLTLTAGKWRISGSLGFLPAAATSVDRLVASVSKTTGTLSSALNTGSYPVDCEVWHQFSQAAAVPGNNAIDVPIPAYRAEVTTDTPIFLVGRANFTVSTLTAFGYLEAVREVPYLTGQTHTVTLRVMGG
jgi:hypothetical protein